MLIILNGSVNAGKTTVGRLLASSIPRCAFVEVDAVRAFIACVPLAESIAVNLESAAAVARILLAHDFHVVVAYPLSRSDWKVFTAHLGDPGVPMHVFTLQPCREVAAADRGTRRLSDPERRRVHEMYDQQMCQLDAGETIDNGAQTPEETAGLIRTRVGLST